jgi:hypothetical protein
MKWVIRFAFLGALFWHAIAIWNVQSHPMLMGLVSFGPEQFLRLFAGTIMYPSDYTHLPSVYVSALLGGLAGAIVGLGISAVSRPSVRPLANGAPQPAAPIADDRLPAAKPPTREEQ